MMSNICNTNYEYEPTGEIKIANILLWFGKIHLYHCKIQGEENWVRFRYVTPFFKLVSVG